MEREEFLIKGLPDREAALRFCERASERVLARLRRDEGLFSDVLTIAAFSPLLATTLLQNEDHIAWLAKVRKFPGIRRKEDLSEELARFQATHSSLGPQAQFAGFRRRELLRIFLRDIRRLATVAEITEEISNVADVILESALAIARSEINARFGQPEETDEKGRAVSARFCIIALGKLGSHELNYSSDIDLIYIYSAEGMTGGSGSKGKTTNREYFQKLSQLVTKLVGEQTGEGGAYRVDLRLRPHGSMGPMAMCLGDMRRYYHGAARDWERQVMIRSRGCAGDTELYRELFDSIESLVFPTDSTPGKALADVKRSKEQIDKEQVGRSTGQNVKLGPGGIREIEFIAQALQLSFGGGDPWIRSPHTLMSLQRLSERGLISPAELTQLNSAYAFLRRTEHILQMENGIQTHTIPDDAEKRALIGRRVEFAGASEIDHDFETDLSEHTENVSRVFRRIFGEFHQQVTSADAPVPTTSRYGVQQRDPELLDERHDGISALVRRVSPHFASVLAAFPQLQNKLDNGDPVALDDDLDADMAAVTANFDGLASRLRELRRAWTRHIVSIAVRDIDGTIDMRRSKDLQTRLAEASLAAAAHIVADELGINGETGSPEFPLSVLALGKLGGRGVDHGSDLDLVLVRDGGTASIEQSARAAELLVNTLSSMTREGSLYRIDLRLRPFGAKGTSTISFNAFAAYIGEQAAIWELLAFVKLRGIDIGDPRPVEIERELRTLIHRRASSFSPKELADETFNVRNALERERSRTRRSGEIDIKYGEGGLLDVYFAMRFLQLVDDIPDDDADRSTPHMLAKLHAAGSLHQDEYTDLVASFRLLADLDHNIRLTAGRSTRVPVGNTPVMNTIAERMNFASLPELIESLSLARLAIRGSFTNILGRYR